MDRRKLCCFTALALAALVGCRRQQTVNVSDPYTPEKVAGQPGDDKASPHRAPLPKKRIEQVAESKELDAKPETVVKIADVQSQVALNANNAADHRQSSTKLAKQNYKRALQLDPNYLPAYLGLARLCSATNDHEQALATLDAGLAKLPKAAALWYERGMVKGRQKQFDEGLENLNKAFALEPDNMQYSKLIGMMLARMGQGEEAVTWLRRSMSEADAHYNVARLSQHIGRAADADKHLQIALRVDPNHESSLAMMNEGKPPADVPAGPAKNGSIQLAGHAPEVRQPLKIVVDAPAAPLIEVQPSAPSEPATAGLPQRPATPVQPAPHSKPAAPAIPILSDQWEPRPVMTPSLEGPGRKTARTQSGIQVGFEPNP